MGIHILTMHYYGYPVFSQYIDNTDICLNSFGIVQDFALIISQGCIPSYFNLARALSSTLLPSLYVYTIANTAPPMHRSVTTTAAITPPAIAPVDT